MSKNSDDSEATQTPARRYASWVIWFVCISAFVVFAFLIGVSTWSVFDSRFDLTLGIRACAHLAALLECLLIIFLSLRVYVNRALGGRQQEIELPASIDFKLGSFHVQTRTGGLALLVCGIIMTYIVLVSAQVSIREENRVTETIYPDGTKTITREVKKTSRSTGQSESLGYLLAALEKEKKDEPFAAWSKRISAVYISHAPSIRGEFVNKPDSDLVTVFLDTLEIVIELPNGSEKYPHVFANWATVLQSRLTKTQ